MNNIINDFENICIKTQKELKRKLFVELIDMGYSVICEDGFLYAKGDIPILLTAHMDTVHKTQVKKCYVNKMNGKIIMRAKEGIGGDDRCGIYMILRIIKDGYKPSILFCEDEEIGGVGSNKFCASQYIDDLKEMKYLIELDRMNGNDAVFYDCDNEEFTEFIIDNTGYKENYGSFSDISHLCPACKVAGVNLSCGYYNAHTTSEYVVIEEMENTIKTVEKLLVTDCKQFEYVESIYCGSNYYRYAYGYGYGDDDWYYSYSKKKGEKSKNTMFMEVLYNKDGKELVSYGRGYSESECWFEFFIDNPDVCWNDVLDYEIY